MTATEADLAERLLAETEGRWAGDRCADHYEILDPDGSCRECLDDAHERWLVAQAALDEMGEAWERQSNTKIDRYLSQDTPSVGYRVDPYSWAR